MWQLVHPDNDDLSLSADPYQLDFATSIARNTLMAGGWGSGKSYAGLLFCALSAWASPPGSVGVVIMPTFPMMREWLTEQFLPAFSRVIVAHNKGDRYIVLPGDRKVYYKSAHDPRQIQMSNAAWAYLDEPHLMKREIWTHTIARVRKKGAALRVGMTSLPKIGWLSEHFLGKDDGVYRCMHVKTAWNRHVSETYVDDLKRACPRRMWPAYLEGQFVATGGSVYPEFDPATHVIPWQFGPVRMKGGGFTEPVVNLSMDPSVRRPHVSWVQRVPAGAIMPGGWTTEREVSIFSDEVYPDGQYRGVNLRRLCTMIRKRRPDPVSNPWPFREAVTDPAVGQRELTSQAVNETGIIQLQKYLDVPILYRTGERIKTGVQHVQLALDPAVGHPYLFFAKRLGEHADTDDTPDGQRQRGLLNSMPGYSYSDEKDGKLPDLPYHDDVFSHAADDVRYHVRQYHPEDRLSFEKWSVM